jgi:uncharacterized protein (DUF433 family)
LAKDYIEKREAGYYVIGSRIPLDTIVVAFLAGDSPETIVTSFSTLTLEQVYGGISFYLANREMIDEYLREADEEYERRRKESQAKDPAFYQRLEAIRNSKRVERP